jgi:hypothetical protein
VVSWSEIRWDPSAGGGGRQVPRVGQAGLSPVRASAEHRAGRRAVNGSPVRGAQSAGRRPDLDRLTARATISPRQDRGISLIGSRRARHKKRALYAGMLLKTSPRRPKVVPKTS